MSRGKYIDSLIHDKEQNLTINNNHVEYETVIINGDHVSPNEFYLDPFYLDTTFNLNELGPTYQIKDPLEDTYVPIERIPSVYSVGTPGTPIVRYDYDEPTPYTVGRIAVVKRTVKEAIFDYSQENLTRLEQSGAKAYAQFKDGTFRQVEWSEVFDPHSNTGAATVNIAEIAAAHNQHFWLDTNGAHVTSDVRSSWEDEYAETNHGTLANPSAQNPWHNILLNSLGILLRRGLINLVGIAKDNISFYDGTSNTADHITATFGTGGAQIGKNTENHMVLSSTGIACYDSNGNLIPVQASNIAANEARIGNLSAVHASILSGMIQYLTATDITTMGLSANDLSAARANIRKLEAGTISASELQALNGFINNFSSLRITTEYLNANYATISRLESDFATIAKLESDYIDAETLAADYATLAKLESDYIDADTLASTYATIASLQADEANIDVLKSLSLAALYGDIDSLTAEEISTLNMNAINAAIQNLETDNFTTENLTAITGLIDLLRAHRITTDILEANYADIGLANVNNAWIENGVIKRGAITDAQIQGVSANKLTAGEINADDIIVRNLQAANLKVARINGNPVIGGYEVISTSLNGYSSKNPVNEGWYEFVNNSYVRSQDTTTRQGVTYYKTSDSVAFYDQSTIDQKFSDVDARIDSQIETWTGADVPLLTNYPANQWDANTRADHVGDIYYVINTGNQYDGFTYRFAYDNTQQSYKWVLIRDNAVTDAISRLLTAEGYIGTLQEFQSDTETWIQETDSGLETIRQNHTNLTTKVNKTIVESTQLWFSKANSTAPAKPNAAVTSTSTSGNVWTTAVPTYNASYPNYFYCYQWKYADGTYGWSSITHDVAMDESQRIARAASSAATAANDSLAGYITSNNLAVNNLGNKIDDISIGGRNLFSWPPTGTKWKDEEHELNNYNDVGSFTQFENCLTFDPLDTIGEEYTISFDVKSPNGNTSVRIYNYNKYVGGRPACFFFTSITLAESVGNEWVHCEKTIINSAYQGQDGTTTNINAIRRIEFYAPNAVGVLVRKIKIEKGNKATDWTPAPEDLYSEMNELQQSLQNQIDEQVDIWYYNTAPTISNAPFNTWTDNSTKDKHVGDLYFDTSKGYSYRLTKSGSTYSWTRIKDDDINAALSAANTAQTTADNKRRIFTSTPTVPYDAGDLWVKGNEVRYANKARTSGSYTASEWSLTATDDTLAKSNIKASVQLWFTKANTTAPAAPSAQVTSTSTSGNVWTTVVPTYNSSYPYYFYCWQYQKGDNSYSWSAVVYDRATTENQQNSHAALTGLETKVDSTVFSTVKDTVDEHSTTITSLNTKIESIKIGGRNLLLNSDKQSRDTNDRPTRYNSGSFDISEYGHLVSGETYTITVEGINDGRRGLCPFIGGGSYNTGIWKDITDIVNVKETWTFVCDDARANANQFIRIYASNNAANSQGQTPTSGTFTCTRVKLEKGNKATDWTPAPEDMATVTDVTTVTNLVNSVQQTASSNSASISELQTTTNNLSSDNTTIRDRLSSVEQDLDGFRTTVSETYVTSSSFNELNDKVDDISIGGRNLIKGSTLASTNTREFTNTISSDSTSGYVEGRKFSITRIDGITEYTLSFEAYASADITAACFWYSPNTTIKSVTSTGQEAESADGATEVPLTTSWKRYWITWTQSDSEATAKQLIVGRLPYNKRPASGSITIHVRALKFEAGNKATDWSPAPEDMATATNLTNEINQRKAAYATCSTADATAAKVATCNNFVLYNGARVSVNFTNTNSTTAPTLNVNGTGAKQIRSYIGSTLDKSEYEWAAGATLLFVYDGTYWRLQDSGSIKRLATAETKIDQNAEAITLRATKTEVSELTLVDGRYFSSWDRDISVCEFGYLGTDQWKGSGQYQDFSSDFVIRVDFVHNSEYSSARYALASPYGIKNPLTNSGWPELGVEVTASKKIRLYSTSDDGTVTSHNVDYQLISDIWTTVIVFWNHIEGSIECIIYNESQHFYEKYTPAGTYTGISGEVQLGSDTRKNNTWNCAYQQLDMPPLWYPKMVSGDYICFWDLMRNPEGTPIRATEPSCVAGKGAIDTMSAQLTIANNNIATKVSTTDYTGATIASKINQSADSVKIQAKHVEIDGAAIFGNSAFQEGLDGALNGLQTQTLALAATDAATKSTAALTSAKNYTDDAYEKIQSQGIQLITNGNGFMKDNTNWPGLTFDGTHANGSPGSFTRSSSETYKMCNDYFLIDPSKDYLFEFDAMSEDGTARLCSFISTYDNDKYAIYPYNTFYYKNTLTTLAQDLNPGDTVIKLTDATNWSNTSAPHQRSIIFWDYTNSSGYTYPPLIYSRNVYLNIYEDDSKVDKVTGTITLKTAWTGPKKTAGTKLSQGLSGNNFNYAHVNKIIPMNWTHYSFIYSGLNTSQTGNDLPGKFRQGTAFGKVGFIWNYQASASNPQGQIWMTNISVKEANVTRTELNALQQSLQNQIDNQVDIWYYNTEPTTSNAPFNTWTDTDTKDKHVGDLYFDTSKGYSYRLTKSGSTYSWTRIKDDDIDAALSAANTAQTTADNKRRVFTSQPTVPYDIGDLWVSNTNGEVRYANKARTSGSFTVSEWSLTATDDSNLNTYISSNDAALANIITNTNNKINDISVGGRNLLEGSMNQDPAKGNYKQYVEETDDKLFGCTVFRSYKAWADIGFDFRTQVSGKVIAGDILTYSIWAKTDDTVARNLIGPYFNKGTETGWYNTQIGFKNPLDTLTNEWKRYLCTFTVTSDMIQNGTYFRIECTTQTTDGTYVYWAAPKLEKGNKPTDWTPAPEDLYSEINEFQQSLQNQIDEQVDIWYYNTAPTTSNAPFNTWTDNSTKDKHVGDLYFDTSKGYSYRLTKSGSTYSWTRIKDDDINAALSAANTAQTTADNKRRVFTSQPTVPYDVGDLWVSNTNGEVRYANKARTSGSFTVSEWSLTATDDSSLNTYIESNDTALANIITNTNNKIDNTYEKIQSQGIQLVTNGNGFMQDNTNWSALTFDGTHANTSPGSFTRSPLGIDVVSDEYFPIDPNKDYLFEFDAMSADGTAKLYSFMQMCDSDKNDIRSPHTHYYPNTLTTLAQDLNPGDTVIKLTNATNWVNTTAAHQRSIIFWDYQNSSGYVYPPLTYSRNVYVNIYEDDSKVDKATGTITLKTAWTGPKKVAGTQLSQDHEGATYSYAHVYITIPSNWNHYSFVYSGLNTSQTGADVTGKFRQGTAFGKVGLRWNYGHSASNPQGQLWVTNISVKEANVTHTELNALQQSLQNQIDNQVDIWYYSAAPTTSNAPFNTWTDNATKDKHVGDLYFDTSKGYSYRLTKSGSTYSWTRIKDNDINAALAAANTAQTTADNKRRVFTSQPTVPYDMVINCYR